MALCNGNGDGGINLPNEMAEQPFNIHTLYLSGNLIIWNDAWKTNIQIIYTENV